MRRPSAISGYSCFCLWHPLAFLSPHSSSLSCSQPPSSTMFMMQEGTFASGPRSSNFSVQGNGLMLWRPGKATQDSAQEKTGRRFLCYDSLPPWAQACYGASNSNQSASHAIYIHGISIPPELVWLLFSQWPWVQGAGTGVAHQAVTFKEARFLSLSLSNHKTKPFTFSRSGKVAAQACASMWPI